MHHGEMLGYKGFSYAPTLEMGVVCLFGAMAADFGFLVESFNTRYPDCMAKRRVLLGSGEARWFPCRIEFEYRSSNFAAHGHDPAGADLVVCWEHDWAEPRVEVLELRVAVEMLKEVRVGVWRPSTAYHGVVEGLERKRGVRGRKRGAGTPLPAPPS